MSLIDVAQKLLALNPEAAKFFSDDDVKGGESSKLRFPSERKVVSVSWFDAGPALKIVALGAQN